MTDKPTVSTDEIHIWHARVKDNASQVENYIGKLPNEELERARRFSHEPSRGEYLTARTLVRNILSLYYPSTQKIAWSFTIGERGKPEVSASQNPLGITFNLTHSAKMVSCAVGRSRDLGIDIESVQRDGDYQDLAQSSFSPQECAELARVEKQHFKQRFFEYWTLKESYIKARGLGLAIPLDQFSFILNFPPGKPTDIGITFGPQVHDDPESWKFHLFTQHSPHLVALGYRVKLGEVVRITDHGFFPLN